MNWVRMIPYLPVDCGKGYCTSGGVKVKSIDSINATAGGYVAHVTRVGDFKDRIYVDEMRYDLETDTGWQRARDYIEAHGDRDAKSLSRILGWLRKDKTVHGDLNRYALCPMMCVLLTWTMRLEGGA